ncbi:MAG: carboxypeptidase-like regulatory domain-containing protein, partial [Candidatus Kapaibacterium sp.]
MKRIILLFLLVPFLNLFSQEEYTLSGYVKDKSSGESLIGATITIKDTKLGAVTNAYGFYSLTLPKGKYIATASYI